MLGYDHTGGQKMSEICNVCMHHCNLNEGGMGRCRARGIRDGKNVSLNYGMISSLALDPIEKKPLKMFHPGSCILSVGTYGCNLSCPFCQNHEIAQVCVPSYPPRQLSPADLCDLAMRTHIDSNNIGIAFTYNEPLIGYEYIYEAARINRSNGLYNVAVTNGSVMPEIWDKLLSYIDAMNIDLKSFTEEGYRKVGGDLSTVMDNISSASKKSHIELTTLIVPGISDDPEDMEKEAAWIASIDPDIPLHITRYFPRYHMTKGDPTDVDLLYRLSDIAGSYLHHVFVGNV